MTLRGAATSIAAVALAIGFPSHALAHAKLTDSTPAQNAELDTFPQQVWAEFSEDPTQESKLEVFDRCGNELDDKQPLVSGSRIAVRTPADETGAFQVQYALISSVDGHSTTGTFLFKVAGADNCANAASGNRNDSEGKGLWDIPATPFLVALGAAALIGVAGGLVYAGIMGPSKS